MTDPRDEQLTRDLERIGSSLPELPTSFSELRSLIARLPAPTAPDLQPARSGIAQEVQTSGFGSSSSPLAGGPIGSDSGSAIGVYPQLFYGKSNLLADPMFERLYNSRAIVVGPTVIGHGWQTRLSVASGFGPTGNFPDGIVAVSDVFTALNLNSAGPILSILITNPAASDFTFTLEGRTSFDTLDSAAYMIGAIRLLRDTANDFTNISSVVATLELVEFGTNIVKATSTPFDWMTFHDDVLAGQSVRLQAAYLNVAPTTLRLRLKIRVVTTGNGGSVILLVGEPQQTHATTEDPPPFSPIVGPYITGKLLYANESSTADEDVILIRDPAGGLAIFKVNENGDIQWGTGLVQPDIELIRSGLKEMQARSHDHVTAVPAFRHRIEGAAFTRGPADMALAISYAAPGVPSAVSRTDDGVLVSSTAINYFGALISSIVTTRFGRTMTVVPTYSGADISAIHRVVT